MSYYDPVIPAHLVVGQIYIHTRTQSQIRIEAVNGNDVTFIRMLAREAITETSPQIVRLPWYDANAKKDGQAGYPLPTAAQVKSPAKSAEPQGSLF